MTEKLYLRLDVDIGPIAFSPHRTILIKNYKVSFKFQPTGFKLARYTVYTRKATMSIFLHPIIFRNAQLIFSS